MTETNDQIEDDENTGLSFSRYFARLFEYDRWANHKIITAFQQIGESTPQTALDRMSHLIACQRLWIARMRDDGTGPKTIFPSIPLNAIHEDAENVFDLVRRFIDDLPENELFTRFRYTSTDGTKLSSLKYEILTQLSQHGCYHRGQIAVEINPQLDQPIATDWVFYTFKREP